MILRPSGFTSLLGALLSVVPEDQAHSVSFFLVRHEQVHLAAQLDLFQYKKLLYLIGIGCNQSDLFHYFSFLICSRSA